MTTTPEINEGDAGDKLVAEFYTLAADGSRSAWTPTSVDYRVDCVTNAEQIKDWTAVSPASSVDVTLDANDTAILDAAHQTEIRRVIVTADRGAATQKSREFYFNVTNLSAFS